MLPDRMWHCCFHLQPNFVAEDSISGPVSDRCICVWLLSQSSTPVLCHNNFICAWGEQWRGNQVPYLSQGRQRHNVFESGKPLGLSAGIKEIR